MSSAHSFQNDEGSLAWLLWSSRSLLVDDCVATGSTTGRGSLVSANEVEQPLVLFRDRLSFTKARVTNPGNERLASVLRALLCFTKERFCADAKSARLGIGQYCVLLGLYSLEHTMWIQHEWPIYCVVVYASAQVGSLRTDPVSLNDKCVSTKLDMMMSRQFEFIDRSNSSKIFA
jgi:hypothetical protein